MSQVDYKLCISCGKQRPAYTFSSINSDVCSKCASKALMQARIDDDTWLEQNRQAGIPPWEKQPQEPVRAYEAFKIAMEALPEKLSFVEIGRRCGASATAVSHWSKRWKWDVRLSDWTTYSHRSAIKANLDERKKLNRRLVEVAQQLQSKAAERIDHIDVDELTPREVIQWLELATKIERTALESDAQLIELEMQQTGDAQQQQQQQQAVAGDSSKLATILSVLTAAGALPETLSVVTTEKTTTIKNGHTKQKTETHETTVLNNVEYEVGGE